MNDQNAETKVIDNVTWTRIPEGEHDEWAVIHAGCMISVFMMSGREPKFQYYINGELSGDSFPTMEKAACAAKAEATSWQRDRLSK